MSGTELVKGGRLLPRCGEDAIDLRAGFLLEFYTVGDRHSDEGLFDMALREPTVFILTALAAGRMHGYGIIQAVRELSSGRLTLSSGTLYGALDRLRVDGHVVLAGEAIEGGPPRRYYELTPAGRELLQTEVQRLHETATALTAELNRAFS